MERRSFLKLLAAGSASVAFPSIVRPETLGLNGKVAPSNRIALGYIGVGTQGGGHFRSNLHDAQFQTNGICDVDDSHVQKALDDMQKASATKREASGDKGCFTTSDFRELVARPDIDAVWISVPDHWHALPLIHAARAGKDIYAEKPLSLTIPEGQAMVRAVEESGVVCQIGSQQRSLANFQRAVQLARNGFLGKITGVHVVQPSGAGPQLKAPMPPQQVPTGFDYEMWLGPAPEAPYYKERCHWNFRWTFDYSGGQLTDWIGHHFDIAAWALGVNRTGPVAIRNARATFTPSPLYNTATDYSFEAHYANGTVINLTSEHRTGLRIEGENGWFWVSREESEFSNREWATVSFPTDGFHLDAVDHTQNFIDCVKSRKTPICPIQEALLTVTVAHLANAAFRSGRSELQWDPERQAVVDAPDAAALLTRAYRSPWQLPA